MRLATQGICNNSFVSMKYLPRLQLIKRRKSNEKVIQERKVLECARHLDNRGFVRANHLIVGDVWRPAPSRISIMANVAIRVELNVLLRIRIKVWSSNRSARTERASSTNYETAIATWLARCRWVSRRDSRNGGFTFAGLIRKFLLESRWRRSRAEKNIQMKGETWRMETSSFRDFPREFEQNIRRRSVLNDVSNSISEINIRFFI